ncbi:hypothetical protein F4779DRAFT_598501 [Xylariaceae sp. FL0662B]|nr:hypothetical protein F4779DRAFT_598501 [Xylariaceae sp. FL0662B]
MTLISLTQFIFFLLTIKMKPASSFLACLSIVCVSQAWDTHSSCNGAMLDRINTWMREALYIYDRAAKVLDESLRLETIPGNIQEILDAILKTGASRQDYEQAKNNFRKLADDTPSADVLVRCGHPERMIRGKFDPDDWNRTMWKLMYPMDIDRAAGDRSRVDFLKQQIPWWFNADENVYYTFSNPGLRAYAYVMTSAIEDVMDVQQWAINSGKLWTDIILTPHIMEAKMSDSLYPGYSDDWRFSTMSHRSLVQGTHPLGSLSMMHELMHSHVALNLCLEHEMVGTIDANGLKGVLLIGADAEKRPLNNPDSYVWLAVSLAMPWYKFWNRTAEPPAYDGVCRWNRNVFQGDNQEVAGYWIPTSIRSPDKGAFQPNELDEFRKGIYANWENPGTP